jgi:hypothetical protein
MGGAAVMALAGAVRVGRVIEVSQVVPVPGDSCEICAGCAEPRTAIVVSAETLGLRNNLLTSALHNRANCLSDFVCPCDGSAFKHLTDAGRRFTAGYPLDGMTEPVEEPALDFVAEPAAV